MSKVVADHFHRHLTQDQGYVLVGVYRRLPDQWAIQVNQFTRRGQNTEMLAACIPLSEVVAALLADPEAFADVVDAIAVKRAKQLAAAS